MEGESILQTTAEVSLPSALRLWVWSTLRPAFSPLTVTPVYAVVPLAVVHPCHRGRARLRGEVAGAPRG